MGTTLLLSWGVLPEVACDGLEAVLVAREQAFDLILMDLPCQSLVAWRLPRVSASMSGHAMVEDAYWSSPTRRARLPCATAIGATAAWTRPDQAQ